jgi:hypothetical protein
MLVSYICWVCGTLIHLVVEVLIHICLAAANVSLSKPSKRAQELKTLASELGSSIMTAFSADSDAARLQVVFDRIVNLRGSTAAANIKGDAFWSKVHNWAFQQIASNPNGFIVLGNGLKTDEAFLNFLRENVDSHQLS